MALTEEERERVPVEMAEPERPAEALASALLVEVAVTSGVSDCEGVGWVDTLKEPLLPSESEGVPEKTEDPLWEAAAEAEPVATAD